MDLVLAMKRQWGWRYVEEFCWKNSGTPKQVKRRFKNQFEPVFQFSIEYDFWFQPDAVKITTDREFVGDGRSMAPQQGVGECVQTIVKPHAGKAYPGNVVAVNYDSHGGTGGGHSAAFPVDLPSFFIKAYSDATHRWLDPFLGSGTTMVAAEQLGRICYGIEISPAYCAVILQRMKDMDLTPRLVE
jgi:site-specific DNA-methyltransferase (adenine-specific)/site-specific DNA-methyltransferase (cytosine-N4-specific)